MDTPTNTTGNDRDRDLENQQFDDAPAPDLDNDTASAAPVTGRAPEGKPSMLVRLRDAHETIAGSDADIRGRKVIDTDGTELGKVGALLIDEHEQKVRFMEVASGGFLGLGRTTVLVPVDLISNLTPDQVQLNQTAEHVERSPQYDPELVEEAPVEGAYAYYGLMPYWGAGYADPGYPAGSTPGENDPAR